MAQYALSCLTSEETGGREGKGLREDGRVEEGEGKQGKGDVRVVEGEGKEGKGDGRVVEGGDGRVEGGMREGWREEMGEG